MTQQEQIVKNLRSSFKNCKTDSEKNVVRGQIKGHLTVIKVYKETIDKLKEKHNVNHV